MITGSTEIDIPWENELYHSKKDFFEQNISNFA